MKPFNIKKISPRKSQVLPVKQVNSGRPNLWKKVIAFGFFAVIPVLFTQKAVFAEGEGFTIAETLGSTSVDESGTSDDFTIVLDVQPASDVTLSISDGSSDETSISPTTVTFTNSNWDTAQTVTVTGSDDDIIDGSQISTITISVVDEISDNAYDSVVDQTFSVTTTDDDSAGFTISETLGTSEVDETGTTDNVSVVLNAEPASDVVISVTSSDTGEVTASPSALTFTSANWNIAQTVTLTGANDNLVDGSQTSTVTLSVVDGSSDDDFDGVADQTVSVTTTDSDVAGFTVIESGGTTTVPEDGSTTDDFTVVLDAQPTSDVVLSIVSADIGEVTVSPATLTFTSGNWDSSQTVTVTGVDDSLIDGSQTTVVSIAVVDESSNDSFDSLLDQTVSVSTADDDTAGFTVSQTDGSSSVTEGGSTDLITVVLDAQPTSNVVLSVVSADTGEATVSPSTLTFTPTNWDTAQTITVTGVDDDQVDGDQTTNITISVVDASSDNDFDGITDQNIGVETADDDSVGFTVVETSGSTIVGEDGSTDLFSIVLNVQPSSDVVFTIASSDTGEATVTSSLTFTSANWDTAQNVTVTGVDDDPIDGDQTSTLTISILDVVSDDDFDNVPDRTLSVTTTDDDVAGFTIAETEGSTGVDESGSTDIFTVVLNAQPTTDVVLTISSGDTGEATVTSSLTFTAANWDTAQNVTVTGADDDIVDGSVTSTITVAINDGSSDDNFDAVANQTVSVTTTDDDVAGFTIAETEGSTGVTEAGSTDLFTVVLDKAPLSDVVFAISSSDTGEATVTSSLTFTSSNWDTPQNVTVTGADDNIIDGSVTSNITVSINDGSSDNAFDAVADQTVSVTTTDDDVAGFTIAETEGSTGVDESGSTDLFTVVLNAQPTTDVVLSISSADTGEATVTSSLTFTSSNWDTAKTVTVTGVDDNIIDGTQTSTITVSIIDGISDNAFDAVADQTVSVTTTDDDVAGFTIAETEGSTGVDESGSTDIFTIVLDTQPSSDVVLSITSSDTGEATVESLIQFTSANWDTAQNVTVTGADDGIIDGTQTSTITVTVVDAITDDDFDAVADQTVSVTTTDDDLSLIHI